MATLTSGDLHPLLTSRCAAVARDWHAAIAPTGSTALSAAAVRQRLRELTLQLVTLLLDERLPPAQAGQIGGQLVQLHYTQPATLQHTLDVLSQQLLRSLPPSQQAALQPRLTRLLNAVSSGFCAALTQQITSEQEALRATLLTERRLVEADQRRSEATNRALLQALPDLILRVSHDGLCLAYHAGSADPDGLEREAIIGRPLARLLPPRVMAVVDAHIQLTLTTGERQLCEVQLMRQGSLHDYEVRVVRCGYDDVVLVARDMTEHKRAIAAARAREAELAVVFEGVAVGLALADPQGRLLVTNAAFQAIVDYSAAELDQRPLVTLAHPEDRSDDDLFSRLARGYRSTYKVDQRIVRRSGEVRCCHLTASLLRGADDQPSGVLVVLDDITERKQTEAALLQLYKQESLGTLAGGIAHEFNNILIVIMGSVELAQRSRRASSMLKHVEQIELAAQRAAGLITQMLTYAGHVSVESVRIDLTALVYELRELLVIAVPRRIQLCYALRSQLPMVLADTIQLRQSLVSLVINAAEAFDQQPGTITISTGQLSVDADYQETAHISYGLAAGRYVYVEVGDSGCGMSPATLARIFDPFFTTKASGSGLSLASVRGVMRSHHGAIQVWTEPGSGTTIRLLLPISAQG